jgi:hypothetical protein
MSMILVSVGGASGVVTIELGSKVGMVVFEIVYWGSI